MSSDLSKYSEYKSIVNDIIESVNQAEFCMNNGQFLIEEYCADLKSKIKAAKEKKLKDLENTEKEMIDYINYYEKQSVELFSKLDRQRFENQMFTFKSLIQNRNSEIAKVSFNKIDFFKLIDEIKQTREEIKMEQEELKSLIFNSNEIIMFKSSEKNNFEEKLLGYLDFQALDTLNYNDLPRVSFGINQLKAIINGIMDNYSTLVDIDDVYNGFRNISEIRMLPNKTLHIFFELNAKCSGTMLFSVILSKNFYPGLSMSKLNDSDNQFRLKPRVYYSNRKTFIVTHQENFASILVYDENHAPPKEIKILNRTVIDINNDRIYVISTREYVYEYISDSINLEIIDFKIQQIDLNKPYYVSTDLKEFLRFESNKKFYWVLRDSNDIRILDESNGLIVKIIRDSDVNRIDIDSRKNLVLFKNDKLVFYSVNGFFLKEIKLINFFNDIKNGLFLYEDKICYFDPFTFELSLQKEFCSFEAH